MFLRAIGNARSFQNGRLTRGPAGGLACYGRERGFLACGKDSKRCFLLHTTYSKRAVSSFSTWYGYLLPALMF